MDSDLLGVFQQMHQIHQQHGGTGGGGGDSRGVADGSFAADVCPGTDEDKSATGFSVASPQARDETCSVQAAALEEQLALFGYESALQEHRVQLIQARWVSQQNAITALGPKLGLGFGTRSCGCSFCVRV